jgi:K+ transporter
MAENEVELTPEEETAYRLAVRRQKWMAGIVAAIYLLLQPGSPTGTIRDIFIIFMAFETLIIGAALVVLIIQVASLINLLQNEVKPILKATTETVNTLRGTTAFLSENLVEPVIKLNSSIAGLRRFFQMFGIKSK